MYVVVSCPRCGELILANTSNKTRSCTNCGYRLDIRNQKPLAKAETPADAVEVMKKLKAMKAGGEEWKPNFNRLK
ncbi:DUF1922 domain-containing protein [Candidatus Bathyarchaeota archaeon]|nr:DUF1922 domain-containing protein [Candidatus Bathyarchaeota archaeon]